MYYVSVVMYLEQALYKYILFEVTDLERKKKYLII